MKKFIWLTVFISLMIPVSVQAMIAERPKAAFYFGAFLFVISQFYIAFCIVTFILARGQKDKLKLFVRMTSIFILTVMLGTALNLMSSYLIDIYYRFYYDTSTSDTINYNEMPRAVT